MSKGYFNAYVLSSLEYCASVWMSSTESYLSLLNSVRISERLCETEFCCLGHRGKVSALWLLYEIYPRVDHHRKDYVKHFVAARNARASAALGELALVIPRR